MPKYLRPEHRLVAALLAKMDGDFLAAAHCYFGGGTQLAMSLGEYRVSRDVDFLCASRDGVRKLRETVSERSLGAVARAPLQLAREVRTDRDGIRTFIAAGDTRIKLEIVFESRIELAGTFDKRLHVATLSPEHAVAEKFLANADRGLDDSTLARDLIDLAFASVGFGKATLQRGLALAEAAYGNTARRYLDQALDRFQGNRSRAAACIASLGVQDTATLRMGLRTLRALA